MSPLYQKGKQDPFWSMSIESCKVQLARDLNTNMFTAALHRTLADYLNGEERDSVKLECILVMLSNCWQFHFQNYKKVGNVPINKFRLKAIHI